MDNFYDNNGKRNIDLKDVRGILFYEGYKKGKKNKKVNLKMVNLKEKEYIILKALVDIKNKI